MINMTNTDRKYRVIVKIPGEFIKSFGTSIIRDGCYDQISDDKTVYENITEGSLVELILYMPGTLDVSNVKLFDLHTNQEILYNYEQIFDHMSIPECKIYFNMPGGDVSVIVVDNEYNMKQNQFKEDELMKPKTQSQEIVTTFQIEEPIAKQLSELLIKQSIREKLLDQNINNPTKYEQMEQMLVPIVAQIESLKNYITKECVPAKYRSEQYVWNYDGYEIDGCTVYIYNA